MYFESQPCCVTFLPITWLLLSTLNKVGSLCRTGISQGRSNKKTKSLVALMELLK